MVLCELEDTTASTSAVFGVSTEVTAAKRGMVGIAVVALGVSSDAELTVGIAGMCDAGLISAFSAAAGPIVDSRVVGSTESAISCDTGVGGVAGCSVGEAVLDIVFCRLDPLRDPSLSVSSPPTRFVSLPDTPSARKRFRANKGGTGFLAFEDVLEEDIVRAV